MHSKCLVQSGLCTEVIGRYHFLEAATERSGAKLTLQLHNWGRKNGRGSLAQRRLRYIVLYCRSCGKMCFPQLRQALVSIVCVIVLFSGCATPYATIGESSERQLAADSYRVLFSSTGYISWDLAYKGGIA